MRFHSELQGAMKKMVETDQEVIEIMREQIKDNKTDQEVFEKITTKLLGSRDQMLVILTDDEFSDLIRLLREKRNNLRAFNSKIQEYISRRS